MTGGPGTVGFRSSQRHRAGSPCRISSILFRFLRYPFTACDPPANPGLSFSSCRRIMTGLCPRRKCGTKIPRTPPCCSRNPSRDPSSHPGSGANTSPPISRRRSGTRTPSRGGGSCTHGPDPKRTPPGVSSRGEPGFFGRRHLIPYNTVLILKR